MSRYRTEREFGGRRARVGDPVVLVRARHDGEPGSCVCAGVVQSISSSEDLPRIVDLGAAANAAGRGDVFNVGDTRAFPSTNWIFRPTATDAEIESLPIGSWTWPIDG